MSIYYQDDKVTLHHGDCLDVLATLPDASVDAVVTDPPYNLTSGKRGGSGAASVNLNTPHGRSRIGTGNGPGGFMGQAWDNYDGFSGGFQGWCQAWAAECLRVLKPGGHLLAFGGTRTWHRLAVAVEDAGFEMRDSLAWLYGSGFPKSMDVSKAIDKAGGDPLAFRRFARAYASAVESSAVTHADIDRHLGIKSSSCYWAREDHRGGMPPRHYWESVRDLLNLGGDFEKLYDEAEREVIGFKDRGFVPGGNAVYGAFSGDNRVTAPATDAAQQWQGWGTALKPSHEPIVMARKPLTGTVAANVLEHGTGALNIDATRIGGGRWPANVVLDESQSAVLDENGGASRFFYVAKAPKSERPVVDGVAHPTVKPLSLASWLVRLVTPPGGTVLEPFAGSGTTVEAAMREGFNVVAVEREADYLPLIVARIDRENARQAAEAANHVPSLFDEAAS